jgi:hypothetical protein
MNFRETNYCVKGIPISLLKPRWYSLLLILKQFFTCKGRYGLVFLYHICLLMNFIGFNLDMPFYLLMSLYNMSKCFKRQGLNSKLFHHGLVKILLIHHFSTIGDSWEVFLMRNGFTQADPTTNPLLTTNPKLDKPMVEDPFSNLIKGPEFTDKNPLDEGTPCKFPPTSFPEKDTDELKVNDPLVPVNDVSLNIIVKSDAKKLCKGTKQPCTYLGFKNKKAGCLISRKLRNRNDTHLSSIDPIEINEGSDPEIEYFLVREDPEFQASRSKVIVPTEPYDSVTNFPPYLKGKEGFSGIRQNLKQTSSDIDPHLVDFSLHRLVISPIQCDRCFHWVKHYYTDIPLLHAQIKTLIAQNDLLRQENLDLKVHAERKTKRIKRSRNIVIKNVTSVKEIINSKLSDPSLVNF